MSMVMFAMICDQCGKRSEEYGYHYHCTECPNGDDVCKDCAWPGTIDEETAKCVCTRCHKTKLAMAAVDDRPVDLKPLRRVLYEEAVSDALAKHPECAHAEWDNGLSCDLRFTVVVQLWRNTDCKLAGDPPRHVIEGYPYFAEEIN